jgi:hypothetical protein
VPSVHLNEKRPLLEDVRFHVEVRRTLAVAYILTPRDRLAAAPCWWSFYYTIK